MVSHFFGEVVVELFAAGEEAEFVEEAKDWVWHIGLAPLALWAREFTFALRVLILKHASDAGDELVELREFGAELFAAGGSERVKAGAAIRFGHFPFGFDPALKEEALQRGIERAFFDSEDVLRDALDGERDAVAV